ncbi:MAG: TonB-dependent receptor, partial [Bryobacteraceae bacterium]
PRNTSDNDFDARKVLNMVIPSSARPGAIENGFPMIATTGFSALGDRVGGSPLLQPDDNYQLSGAITHLRGSHKIKAGVEFRKTRSVRFRSQDNNGTLNFLPGNVAGSGHAFADFLLGLPFSSIINLTPMTVDLLQKQAHFYVADDWAVNKRLTVNVGVRYEFNTPVNEPYGRIPYINLTAPGSVEVQKPGAGLYATDYNNFAPRIGIAYRPKDRTVIRAGYGVFFSESSWLHLTNHVLNPPFFVRQNFFSSRELVLQAQNPFPIGQEAAGGLPAPVAYDRDRRTSYVQTWSFNVQRDLGADIVAEVGYVGNHAVKMARNVQLNIPLPGPGNIQSRRPLQNFGPVSTAIRNDATSSYNGLQTRLEKRFSSGLSLLGAYTFMRALDLSGNEQEGSTIDPRDLNRDRALSDNFVKHRLSVSYVYELPIGAGKAFLSRKGLVDQVLGGWQLSGVTTYQSGPPFTASVAGDRANVGLGTRPNRTCDGNISGGTVDRWFDTNCFAAPDQFTFGNSGRNILIGQSMTTWDVAIMKRFPVIERHYLQVRAEMFNAFNKVNLGVPGGTVGTPAFGRITSADNARSIQFGLK